MKIGDTITTKARSIDGLAEIETTYHVIGASGQRLRLAVDAVTAREVARPAPPPQEDFDSFYRRVVTAESGRWVWCRDRQLAAFLLAPEQTSGAAVWTGVRSGLRYVSARYELEALWRAAKLVPSPLDDPRFHPWPSTPRDTRTVAIRVGTRDAHVPLLAYHDGSRWRDCVTAEEILVPVLGWVDPKERRTPLGGC